MYGEGFQDEDLHDRTHIPKVDWRNNRLQPIQHQETEISFNSWNKGSIQRVQTLLFNNNITASWLKIHLNQVKILHFWQFFSLQKPQKHQHRILRTYVSFHWQPYLRKRWLWPPPQWFLKGTWGTCLKYLFKTLKLSIKPCDATLWLLFFCWNKSNFVSGTFFPRSMRQINRDQLQKFSSSFSSSSFFIFWVIIRVGIQ